MCLVELHGMAWHSIPAQHTQHSAACMHRHSPGPSSVHQQGYRQPSPLNSVLGFSLWFTMSAMGTRRCAPSSCTNRRLLTCAAGARRSAVSRKVRGSTIQPPQQAACCHSVLRQLVLQSGIN